MCGSIPEDAKLSSPTPAGGLVVLDLKSGESRRLLEGHDSVKAEPVVLTIGGREWKPNGEVPQAHADSIALTPDGAYVYYKAVTGRTLYRIPTASLLDTSLSSEARGAEVEKIGETGATDGIEFRIVSQANEPEAR